MQRRRAHLIIRGLVQGVSYRASAQEQAVRLGLLGWVRNLANGDVEALAEGAPADLEAFVTWCRQGPRLARVESVERHDAEATGEFAQFMVTQ